MALPKWMTEQQYSTFYSKQSESDKKKLQQAGYSIPWSISSPSNIKAPTSPLPQRKYDFGDVSWQSTAWQTETGFRTSMWESKWLPTKQQDLGTYNVFGEQAKQAESQRSWTLATRNDIIANNLIAWWKTWIADITTYLQSQSGFMNATPEEQNNTIRAIQERIGQMWGTDLTWEKKEWIDTKQPPAEMLADYWDEALRQAEYYTEMKQQEDFARSQQEKTLKIRNLEWDIIEIERSQRLRDAEDQVNDLKQNIWYLGTMWQPWVSAQSLSDMEKQIWDAEQIYKEMVQIETNLAQIRELWLDIDTAWFEENMRRLQVDLDAKVNQSIQEALDKVSAAEMAWEYDTVEEVEQLRSSLFQNLDKVLMWEIVGNSRDRQLVIDRYQNALQQAQESIARANTVNNDMSNVLWYYVDGNGSPIIGANWQPVVVPTEAPMDPIFQDWSLITFRTWPDGNIQADVQQILPWSQWDVNMALKIMESSNLDDNQKKQLLNEIGYWQLAEQVGAETYKAPSYTPANIEQQKSALEQIKALWDWSTWGQCWSFVNNYLQDMGIWRLFTDPIDAKLAIKNSEEPKVGSVAIIDWRNNPNASLSQQKYGHVWIIESVNDDWTVTVKQSNKSWDEKVFTSKYKLDQISWYFDPTKASEWTTEIMWSLWIPVSYERSVKNFVPATLMNSEIELKQLNETIKSMYEWWISEDDAALYFMWFNIKDENNKAVAKDLVSVWRMLPDDMQQSYVKSISDFINWWNIDGAIKKAELTALDYAKKVEWGNFISESTVKTATERSNEIENTIKNIPDSPIWVVSWTMQKWLWKLKGSDAQEIQTQITQAVAQMRNQLLWSAVTPSEAAFLQPLIPDLNDTPANFMIKLNNLKKAPLTQHNNIRTTYWLPVLDENTLLNQSARRDLYVWLNWQPSETTNNTWTTGIDFQWYKPSFIQW